MTRSIFYLLSIRVHLTLDCIDVIKPPVHSGLQTFALLVCGFRHFNGRDFRIYADPGIGAVATLDGRTDTNRWFASPVTTHRWSLLTR